MDRTLDEIVSERQRGSGSGRSGGFRGRRGGRRNDRERNDYPRDGVRKVPTPPPHPHPQPSILFEPPQTCRSPYQMLDTSSLSTREDSRNIDSEWVHDKYDDNTAQRSSARGGGGGGGRRYSPEPVFDSTSAKLRVENLHYDLTEEDLDDLFNRIGPVLKLSLVYDRAGRSEGVAYVTYESPQDAKRAVREFDGANAKGQPIHLLHVPSGPQGSRRNPFDSAVAPSRPLADRITRPTQRSRSLSPIRHSDVSKPPPSNVDRYVPGQGRPSRDSRSPAPRRRDGRRPGVRRGGERGGRGGGERERLSKDGRPKKTQEELDAEMEDYWGANNAAAATETTGGAPAASKVAEDDIDMII